MSNILYNAPPYKSGDWRKYCVHSDTEIKGFFGPYRFLSNFEPCLGLDGYPTVENAYMAEKVVPESREFFKTCSAVEAKKSWRKFKLLNPETWDSRKYNIMFALVKSKFINTPQLKQKLLDTENKQLIELNWWRDSYWGVDIKLGGENNMGKILMAVRDIIKNNRQPGDWYGDGPNGLGWYSKDVGLVTGAGIGGNIK